MPDLETAADRLVAAGIGLVRRADDLAAVKPGATGDVAVALVDRLLPGDPRTVSG